MNKVTEMQDRIKTRLGVESSYRGPDPACVAAGLQSLLGGTPPEASEACELDATAHLASVGHEFEFLGTPQDYPECRYCWVIEENDVLMWIVLPHCGEEHHDVMLPF